MPNGEKAEVPEAVEFQTKPEIALDQIRAGGFGRRGPRRGTGRCRLWHQHRFPRRTHRTWTAICRGRAKLDDGLGTWETAFTGRATKKKGTASAATAARADHHPVSVKQLAMGPAFHRLQEDHLAGRHGAEVAFPLCRRPGTPGPSRLLKPEPHAGRMVADRMAEERSRTDQILVIDDAAEYQTESSGKDGQTPLDH